MRNMIKRGLRRCNSSQPKPHFSRVPGRKFSTKISASKAKLRAIACPSGRRKSRQIDSLLRDCACHQTEVPSCNMRHFRKGSPSPGASTLMISAPKSANVLAAKGPAINCPNSNTLIPARICRITCPFIDDYATSNSIMLEAPKAQSYYFNCVSN